MHQFLTITAAGLVVALAAGPAIAQSGTDSSSSSSAAQDPTKGGAIRGENMPGGTSRDSGISYSGTDSSGGIRDAGISYSGTDTSGTIRDAGISYSEPEPTSSGGGTMSRDNGGMTSGDLGMRGARAGKSQVRQVQEALKAQGHDPGSVDGVMGRHTQEAIRAYQRSQNLTETGRLDAQTSEKLGVGAARTGSPSR
jgi:hypothetical protein